MIGRRVDDYVLTHLLGEGGMGAVYAGHHHDADIAATAAIKVLLPAFAREPAMVRRFKTEAMAATRLKHDNIIRVENFGTLEDGTTYIVMELLDGVSLQKFLADQGRLGIHQALHIVCQVAAALKAAHDRGIVHRDLKPANVFLVDHPRNPHHVKLLDFGIAKLWEPGLVRQTQTGLAMGTPPYMSPEAIDDASRAGVPADIYSLGVMIYELVTGHLPYDPNLSTALIYEKQKYEGPPPPEFVPAEWQRVLVKTLSFDPQNRFPTVQSLISALASATPGRHPHEPSGAEIVQSFAPELSHIAHMPADAETLRNVDANIERMALLLWSSRLPRIASRPAPAMHELPVQASPRPVDWSADRPPTARMRPVPANRPTTLSSASGPVAAPIAQVSRGMRGRIFVGVALLAVAGGATAGLLATREGERKETATHIEPDAATSQPASPGAEKGQAIVPVDAAPTVAPDKGAQGKVQPAAATLRIETTPSGAEVQIDGTSVGRTPYVVTGMEGDRLSCVVELDGYRRVQRTLLLAPGDSSERIRLSRAKSAPRTGTANGSGTAEPPSEGAFDPDAIGGD